MSRQTQRDAEEGLSLETFIEIIEVRPVERGAYTTSRSFDYEINCCLMRKASIILQPQHTQNLNFFNTLILLYHLVALASSFSYFLSA